MSEARRDIALSTPRLLAHARDGIGWIVFNHPERRNAMSLDMWAGLAEAAQAFESDPAVRVVVMRGAGGRAFVSGADISEFESQRANAAQKRTYDEIAARGQAGLAGLGKPLIALIEGYCVGGGLALALGADIRFATGDARFAIPAARLGLGYDYRGLATLARLVGPSVAKDILFSARFIEAPEALALGLVNFVSEASRIEQDVQDYAARVANNAPLTVRAAKAAVRAFEAYADAQASEALAAQVAQCFDSEDYREGRRAFMDKRAPRFRGV
jgi:enoyl-CoA hydratase